MTTLGAARLSGYRVIVDANLTDAKTVQRSWRERLFTRPWRPFRRAKTIQVPSSNVVLTGRTMILHPATLAQLRASGVLSDARRDDDGIPPWAR